VAADAKTHSSDDTFVARRSNELPGLWVLSGIIDENADLSFFAALSGPTRLHLRAVRRINSFGVRSWIDAVRRVPPDVAFELVECSPAVIDQTNMVAGFLGHGHVKSFYAPMLCPTCGFEKDELFETETYRRTGRLREVLCPECGSVMQVDDLEEHYLLFARESQ
jgi:hypothetical protein